MNTNNAVADNQTSMARHSEPNNTGVTWEQGMKLGGLEASKFIDSNIVLQFPARCAEKSESTVNKNRKSKVKVHQFIPMDDRKSIARAFYVLGRSVRWLAKMASREGFTVTECTIEEIIRSEHDEQVGVLRHALNVNVVTPRPSGPIFPRRAA